MQNSNQYHPFGAIIIRARQPDAVSEGVRKMKGFKVFSSSNQIMQDMVAGVAIFGRFHVRIELDQLLQVIFVKSRMMSTRSCQGNAMHEIEQPSNTQVNVGTEASQTA